jgi:hypothetical protein
MSFRLPLWVYWTLAGLGVAGATAFTIYLDFSTVDTEYAAKLMFTVWGGPLTLVIAASLITWLARTRGG